MRDEIDKAGRSYQKPTLTVFGDFRSLTLGWEPHANADSINSAGVLELGTGSPTCSGPDSNC